jgi:hypothetical protein
MYGPRPDGKRFLTASTQAIADGILIDVTAQAAEVGFKVHTVVTDHLYEASIVPPAGLEGEGQSIEGRLHGLIFRTLHAAKAIRDSDPTPTHRVAGLQRSSPADSWAICRSISPASRSAPGAIRPIPANQGAARVNGMFLPNAANGRQRGAKAGGRRGQRNGRTRT